MTKGGFYRGGAALASAVAGVDQALWDIKGKALGVPVFDLLGGAVRDRMRTYCWVGSDDPAEAAEQALAKKAQGFDAIKMNGSGRMHGLESKTAIDAVVARVAAVRDAVGDEFDIAVDFHGRTSPAVAREACRLLEPLHPFFVEEPVVPERSAELAGVCASTTVPIATGERLYSRWDFREVFGLGIHYHQGSSDLLDYLVDPSVFEFCDGSVVALLTGPGLGVEINEAAVRRAAESPHSWRNPVWWHDDGSFAEW